jgi:hypothetical protein
LSGEAALPRERALSGLLAWSVLALATATTLPSSSHLALHAGLGSGTVLSPVVEEFPLLVGAAFEVDFDAFAFGAAGDAGNSSTESNGGGGSGPGHAAGPRAGEDIADQVHGLIAASGSGTSVRSGLNGSRKRSAGL